MLHSSALPCHSGGLGFLCTLAVEGNEISLAIRAVFICMTAQYPFLRSVSDHEAPVLPRSVWSGTLATHRLVVATLVVNLAPPAAELTEAVGACVHIQFDLVLYFRSSHFFIQ
jgi:hypothetical protein